MKLFEEIGIGLTLTSELPAAINFIESELPTVETEIKTAYEAVLVPGKAIVADVELTVKGGAASVVTQNAEKTIADLGALVTALETLIPTLETEGKAEYAKLLPIIQPIMTALKINLPAAAATT